MTQSTEQLHQLLELVLTELDRKAIPIAYMQEIDRKGKAFIEQAARSDTVASAPQIDPVHGDCLPPIGSRVFIRHGRDDDAHACIVTGYYAWGDLKGSKHLHRVFARLVYEGTDTKQARMLCDCYATAEDALAAAPQPPANET